MTNSCLKPNRNKKFKARSIYLLYFLRLAVVAHIIHQMSPSNYMEGIEVETIDLKITSNATFYTYFISVDVVYFKWFSILVIYK
jgi:hypothetical protein